MNKRVGLDPLTADPAIERTEEVGELDMPAVIAGRGRIPLDASMPLRGWRAETGYRHGPRTTAADVVRYEQDVLGNQLDVDEHTLRELEGVPASHVTWVTSRREVARRYGDDCDEVILVGARLIAEDLDGGMLVLLPGALPNPG